MSGTLRRVLFVSGSGSGNTLRYRVRLAEEALRSRGVATMAVHFTDPLARRWADGADVVALYRTPGTRRVLDLVRHAREDLGIPVTFDVDDLVFLPAHLDSIPFLDDLPVRTRRLFSDDVARRGNVVPFVDRASGTTEPVVADLRTLTDAPVDVVPNGVSRAGREIAARTARPTAGSGSATSAGRRRTTRTGVRSSPPCSRSSRATPGSTCGSWGRSSPVPRSTGSATASPGCPPWRGRSCPLCWQRST
jgi:hypothetical protein